MGAGTGTKSELIKVDMQKSIPKLDAEKNAGWTLEEVTFYNLGIDFWRSWGVWGEADLGRYLADLSLI